MRHIIYRVRPNMQWNAYWLPVAGLSINYVKPFDTVKKAVAINPGDFEAHNNLGVIYARQGKLDLAISEWEAVLKIDPDNREARGNILKAKKMLNK